MLAIWDTLTDIRKARSKRKEASDRTTLCSCVGGLLLHTFLHAVSEGEYIFCALYRGAVCKKNRGNTLPLYTYSILHFTFRYPVAISRGREDGRIFEQKNFLVVDFSQLNIPLYKICDVVHSIELHSTHCV